MQRGKMPNGERQYFRTSEQVKAWKTLARAADDIGDNLPCRQAPDMFHAAMNEGYYIRMAKRACQQCPIRNLCLEYAITHNETEGVWGGLTISERRALRRKRKATE